MADLDARARGRRHAARDQPLDRRLRLEHCARRRRGERRRRRGGRSPSTRTGSRATTRRRRRFYGRCYLVYTHSADADMLAVRWSDDGGLTWSLGANIGARPAVGVFPAIRPNGDLVAVYLLEAGGFAVAASRSTDGGATWAPPVRIAGVDNGCAVQGFRAFPLPSAGRRRDRAACGRPGTTASRRACAGTRCSSRRRQDGAAVVGQPSAVTRGGDDVLPAIGTDPATRPDRNRVHALRPQRHRHDARRVSRGPDPLGRRATALGGELRIAVHAANDVGPDARRLHLGALRERTSARRRGCSPSPRSRGSCARPCTRPGARRRSGARRSCARGTPRSRTGSARPARSARRA